MGIYEEYRELVAVKDDIERAVDILCYCFGSGHKLLICGNGGSAADSEHISGELLKSFMRPRPIDKALKDSLLAMGMNESAVASLEKGFPAIPLVSLTALSTAFSNDRLPETVFAQGVNALGNPGDVLIALTTSGNSANTLYAAMTAKAKGLNVISLTGSKGGKISGISDICIKAPADETYKVQEYHLPIYHHICAEIEKRLI